MEHNGWGRKTTVPGDCESTGTAIQVIRQSCGCLCFIAARIVSVQDSCQLARQVVDESTEGRPTGPSCYFAFDDSNVLESDSETTDSEPAREVPESAKEISRLVAEVE